MSINTEKTHRPTTIDGMLNLLRQGFSVEVKSDIENILSEFIEEEDLKVEITPSTNEDWIIYKPIQS